MDNRYWHIFRALGLVLIIGVGFGFFLGRVDTSSNRHVGAREVELSVDSVAYETITHAQSESPVIGLLPPPIHPLIYENEQERSDADLLAQRWMAWSTVTMALVTLVGVALIAATLLETRGLLKQAKEATVAARKTNETAEVVAFNRNRPWVSFRDLHIEHVWMSKRPNETYVLNVRGSFVLVNSGTSPALHCITRAIPGLLGKSQISKMREALGSEVIAGEAGHWVAPNSERRISFSRTYNGRSFDLSKNTSEVLLLTIMVLYKTSASSDMYETSLTHFLAPSPPHHQHMGSPLTTVDVRRVAQLADTEWRPSPIGVSIMN